MNKSIRVTITSFILLAIFISAGLTWEACKTKTKTLEEKADDAFEQHGGDEFFEDDLADETYETDDSETTDFSEDNSSKDVDYSEVEDKTSYTEPEEVVTYEEEPVRRATAQGKYLIVAGNFLVENNASQMVDKLVNLGYNSAEVAVFDYSQYYTVVASRTDDYALASSLSQEIKNKGVDCYVHTRK